MKTIKLYFFLTLIAIQLHAQLPATVVSDPKSYGFYAEQVAQGAETVSAVNQQIDLLTDVKEKLEKVSNAVKQARLLRNIIGMGTRLKTKTEANFNLISDTDLFSPSELRALFESTNIILSAMERTTKIANDVLSDGFFNMSDAERIEMLRELEADIAALSSEMDVLFFRYRSESERRMLDVLFGAGE
ncbi:MAG: hypothetical protein AAF620_01110 [Bacteroidota bacterium]